MLREMLASTSLPHSRPAHPVRSLRPCDKVDFAAPAASLPIGPSWGLPPSLLSSPLHGFCSAHDPLRARCCSTRDPLGHCGPTRTRACVTRPPARACASTARLFAQLCASSAPLCRPKHLVVNFATPLGNSFGTTPNMPPTLVRNYNVDSNRTCSARRSRPTRN